MTTKRDQLDALNDGMLQCRSSAYRHSWDDFTPHPMPKFMVRPDLMLRCTRCSTEKYLWMDYRGYYTIAPRYVYPEGYRVKGLFRGDRLTAAELRIETVRRLRKQGKTLKESIRSVS